MAERPDSAKAQIKLRLREPLRARLEEEAKRGGFSLNTEIARRLEHSLIDDHIGSIVFHDQNVFALANTFATLVRAYQIRREKSWEQDPEICRLAADSLCAFLATAPELAETGIWPGGLRKTADQGALALIEAFIEAAENVKASDA